MASWNSRANRMQSSRAALALAGLPAPQFCETKGASTEESAIITISSSASTLEAAP